VFVSTRAAGYSNIWTLDLESRRVKQLTSGAGGDFRPSWSPDGQWIAFSSSRGAGLPFARGRWEHLQLADLYLVHPNGSGLKRIGSHGEFCGSPKWIDARHVMAYCMPGESTLDARRNVPETTESTRIVSIDVESGAIETLPAGEGMKYAPFPLGGGAFGYLRKAGAGASGIYYSSGLRGPKGDIRSAAWSADGTRVVFHKRLTFDRKPWVPTWSRSADYALTLMSVGAAQPSFNRTGDRFTFVAPGTGSAPIGVGAVGVSSAGSEKVDVIYADKTRNVLGPQWSPSGDTIIFGIGIFDAFFNGFHGRFVKAEDRVEGGAQIAIVNADGSGFREVTSGPNNNGFPSMAPDGARFVYRTFGPDGEGLRIMNLTTRQVTKVTEGYDNFPLWSPRGDLIMFSRQADGDYEIWTVKPDGTGVTRLTFSPGNDAHMGWSPDGEHIVFASSRMGFKDECAYTDAPQPYGELFVMRADGSHVEQLTDNQWEDGTPSWQPTTTASARR
jgi:Tol biopolymer transport system component